MINIHLLTEKDRGRWVMYKTAHKFQIGRIKNWNKQYIFIVCHSSDNWDLFMEYTGVATEPEDLQFIELTIVQQLR